MLEIYIILLILGITCAISGVYVVLKNMSMTGDAISHASVLGIVIAYILTGEMHSIYLVVFGVIASLLMVFLSDYITHKTKITKDASLGITFPLFFSLGIILVSTILKNVHFCTDTVLMGEVIMAPLRRMNLFGLSISKSLFSGTIVLIINIIFISIFYKEMKITTFDKEFAVISGFSFIILNYLFSALITINALVSFDAIGAILVISFLTTPAKTALYFTKNVMSTIICASIISIINITFGFLIALRLDVNIAGSVAFINMITFLFLRMFRKESVLFRLFTKKKSLEELAKSLVIMHIKNHQETSAKYEELGVNTIYDHLNMPKKQSEEIINLLMCQDMIQKDDKIYTLTEKGSLYYKLLKREHGI